MNENIYPLFGGRGKIIPLSEGSFTIDKSKLFVPFDDLKDDLQARSSGLCDPGTTGARLNQAAPGPP